MYFLTDSFTCNCNDNKSKQSKDKELIHGVSVSLEAGVEAPEINSDLTVLMQTAVLSM